MRRLLLRDEARRDLVEAHLRDEGWTCVETSAEPSEIVAYKSAWVSGDAVLSYIEDAPFDCGFVFVTDAHVAAVARRLADVGLLLPVPEVLATPVSGGPSALRTIGRLGLMTHGDVDDAVLARMKSLLTEPNEELQRYAIFALSNTNWREFGMVLERGLEDGVFGALAGWAESMLNSLYDQSFSDELYEEQLDEDEELP